MESPSSTSPSPSDDFSRDECSSPAAQGPVQCPDVTSSTTTSRRGVDILVEEVWRSAGQRQLVTGSDPDTDDEEGEAPAGAPGEAIAEIIISDDSSSEEDPGTSPASQAASGSGRARDPARLLPPPSDEDDGPPPFKRAKLAIRGRFIGGFIP
jgi:hypothetical protein